MPKLLPSPPLKLLNLKKYNLCLPIGRKLISNGWITSKTGALAGNFGGGIEFQFGLMNQILLMQAILNQMSGKRMALKASYAKRMMSWIHGFHLAFGHLQPWDGLKKMKS